MRKLYDAKRAGRGLSLSLVALLFVAGCGGGGSSSDSPQGSGRLPATPTPVGATPTPGAGPTLAPGASPSPGSHSTATPAPHATVVAASPTPVATGVPTTPPSATPTPVSGSSIISDTNPSTSGVFIGDTCVSPHNDYACVTGYAPTYRHSLSFYVSFTDWSTSLASFISSESMAGWQAINVSPLITWDPIGVQYTDVIAGKWDAYLIASAQAVKAFNGTIFLRPFHEFNGKYTSYGLANQGADATADANFILTWQRMVTIFRQQGVTNVRWVWCYANKSVPDEVANPWNDPANAYPGDAYVDWVSFDAFNRGSQLNHIIWQPFETLINASYVKAVTISPVRPVMIAELGSNEWGDAGVLKSQWISAMFAELPGTYPHIRAVDYFDLSNGDFSYGLQSTPAAYSAWVNGMRSVGANGVLNFRGNGAPLDTLTTWQQ